MKTAESLPALEFHPVTPERWDDLEKLFGPHGASSGCWCMWWRLPRAQYRVQYPRGGQKNKEGLKAIVDSGPPPGLLAQRFGQRGNLLLDRRMLRLQLRQVGFHGGDLLIVNRLLYL